MIPWGSCWNRGPAFDAAQVLHVYPSYRFKNNFTVGASFSWASGVPRTSLLAHPIYQNGGEIPGINPVYSYWADPDVATSGCDSSIGSACALAKTSSLATALSDPNAVSSPFLYSYRAVKRDNLGRTPALTTLDLLADYPLQFGRTTLHLMATVWMF